MADPDMPTHGRLIYRFFDYIALGCLLGAVEEFIRGSSWHIWLGALVVGAVLLCLGDAVPKMKAKLSQLIEWLRNSKALAAALAENAALKTQLAKKAEPIQQVSSVVKQREYWQTVFTVQDIKLDLAVDPNIIYKNKLIIVLTNQTGRDVQVWTPIWESKDVFYQQPFASKLRKEKVGGGWKSGQWQEEEQCTMLQSGQTVICWIGLNEPPGEGLKRRIEKQTTGTAIFPVKIDGKLYDAPIKA